MKVKSFNMTRCMKQISDILSVLCENKELHCLAITGNDDRYDVVTIGDYDEIGESLYFALTSDEKLLKTVADAVRIATEVMR